MDNIPKWVSNYIGLSFETYNCWQLVCLVYREQFGIMLPDLSGEYEGPLDKENIKALYERELPATWRKVEQPQAGDCAVCKIQGQPWHVGVVVGPGVMLHTEKHLDCVIERYAAPIWANRIMGFYRYDGK